MPRPIDADALKDAFEEDGHLSGYIEEYIDEQPTLSPDDARPVGKWNWTVEGDEDYEQFWVCSRCGAKMYFATNYCPNCGAKMEMEVHE